MQPLTKPSGIAIRLRAQVHYIIFVFTTINFIKERWKEIYEI